MIPKVKIGETDVLAMRVNMISELPGRQGKKGNGPLHTYIHTYIYMYVVCVMKEKNFWLF